MHDGTGLAMVPDPAAATRDEQFSREMSAILSRAPQVPVEEVALRVEHFLLGGSRWTLVDIDGSERTDVAEVAASLDAIERGQAVRPCLCSMSFSV